MLEGVACFARVLICTYVLAYYSWRNDAFAQSPALEGPLLQASQRTCSRLKLFSLSFLRVHGDDL